MALTPMVIILISAVSTSLDRPKGYIQRVGMASLSFLLFGTCLGHLSYLANDSHFRSLMLLLVFSVASTTSSPSPWGRRSADPCWPRRPARTRPLPARWARSC